MKTILFSMLLIAGFGVTGNAQSKTLAKKVNVKTEKSTVFTVLKVETISKKQTDKSADIVATKLILVSEDMLATEKKALEEKSKEKQQ